MLEVVKRGPDFVALIVKPRGPSMLLAAYQNCLCLGYANSNSIWQQFFG